MNTTWWLLALTRVRSRFSRHSGEDGQGLVEYALILSFIAIVVVVALSFLQPAISRSLNSVANGI